MKSNDITNDVAKRLAQSTAIERRMSENAAYRKACRRELYELMSLIEEVVFPAFFGELPLPEAVSRIRKIVRHQASEIRLGDEATIADVADRFIERLPDIKNSVLEDVEAVAKIDPAVTDISEIIVSYPAVKAMLHYRTANTFVRLGVPIIPRIITEMAHSTTGIDIHPAATIGRRFAIDHGTGIVIGATTIIGDNVTLYQGVTLGAKSFPLDEKGNPMKGIARHPILEDNVIVYSNATILGRITLAKGTVIGGNVWVTESTKPGEQLLQAKQRKSQVVRPEDWGGL